jgi:asparagine synthase (glutamine-hydrolysing)
MCGIGGYLGNFEDSQDFLESGIENLGHRGPDGHDLLNLKWSGVFHTRLALIDPTDGGKQPKRTKRFSMVFNGEIYNWKLLRHELASEGVHQVSDSDSETLLNAFEKWGITKTLPKLRGIFAIILINNEKKQVSLIRDQFGTKPLYYFNYKEGFFFASEIKAFKNYRLKVNVDGLREYLTFQNFIGENTLFESVNLVKPGSVYTFSLGSSGIGRQVWDQNLYVPNDHKALDQNVEEFKAVFDQAIRRNFTSDFTIGTYLSGGIDSSLVTATSKAMFSNFPTFTIGFAKPKDSGLKYFNDERENAKIFAEKLNLPNYSLEIGSKDFENSFSALSYAIEEPRVGQSYPNFFAAQLASRYAKGCLAGTGGDELFGGYIWRYESVLNPVFDTKEKQILEYFKFWHRLGDTNLIAGLLRMSEREHVNKGYEVIKQILEENSEQKNSYRISDLLYFESKTFLQGLLLVEDKISMVHGVETRVPFLDQDVSRFARGLNSESLIGINSGVKVGKLVPRLALEELNLGNEGFTKQGFAGPDLEWFRTSLKDWIYDQLDQDQIIWNYLDFDTANQLLSDFFRGKNDNRLFIWSLLSINSSLKQFII